MQPFIALVQADSPVTPLANHQQFLFICLLLLTVLVGLGLLLWQLMVLGDRIGRVEKSLSRVRARLSKRREDAEDEEGDPEEKVRDLSSRNSHSDSNSRSRRMTELKEEDEEDDEGLPQKLPVKYTCSCGRKWKISSPGHYKCKCGKKFTV